MMRQILPLVALAFGFVNLAEAQVTVPGAAQPGLIERQIESPLVPDGPEAQAMPEIPTQQMIEGAEDIRFTLNSLTLENSTIYTDDDLQPYYADMIGEEVSLADIYALANDLTLKYRDDGYIMTQVVVPEQDITGGNVTLEAIEGFLNEINIEYQDDVDRRTKRFFKRMVHELKQSQPLTAKVLERQLLLMNDLPGITASAVVRPAEATPKAADMFIVVSTKATDAYVSADNRGSRFVGPLQLQGGITFNELLGHTNAVGLRLATTGQTRELRFIEGTYTQHVCPNGCKLELLASHTNSTPGYTLETFNVESENVTLQAKFSYPIWRARAENLEVYGLFAYRDLQTDSLNSGLSEDRIRVLRAGIDWNKASRNFAVTSMGAELSQGLGIMNSTDGTGTVSTSRANAEDGFTKLEIEATREQFIPGTNFSLFGALGAQLTPDNLYSSEQFSLGGSNFGRGYDPSEITGDNGAAAKIEARYTQFPNSVNWLESTQYYAFYDAGVVDNNTLLVGEASTRRTLTSAGLGVRLASKDDLRLDLEVAKPLTRNVAVEGDDDARAYFRIVKEW